MKKGKIKPIWTVHCICDSTIGQGETKQDAANTARRLGWKLTMKHGWLCPFCRANPPQPKRPGLEQGIPQALAEEDWDREHSSNGK